MAMKMNKKKVHHFVHDAYISAWRDPNRIFAFNLVDKKSFEATGRNSVGAIGKFNNFSFDDTVVSLLNYTFEQRAQRLESAGTYEVMLAFTNFMKDYSYQDKTENVLEDFYGHFEAKIGRAMRSVFRNELQIVSHDPAVLDGLIYLYCLQLMRTPKTRRSLSTDMAEIFYGDTKLNEQQKKEYLTMYLLISSLAMAADILKKGCALRLRYARFGEKFANSDAPVILLTTGIGRIEDHKGCIPLSPRLLMEVGDIGLGHKMHFYSDMENEDAEKINLKMISNAERMVYFSSRNHREKYLNLMMARRG